MATFTEAYIEAMRQRGSFQSAKVDTTTMQNDDGTILSVAHTPGQKIVISLILPEDCDPQVARAAFDRARDIVG